jgi:hypothetical protein
MIRLDRIMISSLYLSMISGQTLRVSPEGKPVSTFPDHALGVLAGIAAEAARSISSSAAV